MDSRAAFFGNESGSVGWFRAIMVNKDARASGALCALIGGSPDFGIPMCAKSKCG